MPVATTIRARTIYVYDGPGPWDGSFTYYIYSDATGSPGAMLSTGPGANVHVSDSGIVHGNGSTIWQLDFELNVPHAADAGVAYWLGVHLASDWVRTDVRWAASAAKFEGNNRFQLAGAGPWLGNACPPGSE